MHTLIIVALGLFFNPTTGDQQTAISQVPSVIDCANLINGNREPRDTPDGTYYLVVAECRVVEQ